MKAIPTTDPIDESPGKDDATDEEFERQPRALVPRTCMTAGAWLAQRAEAQRILALPAVQQVRRALSRYTCLGCGEPGVASYCDACVEWGE